MGDLIIMAWLLSLGVVPNSTLETKSRAIEASNYLVQNFGVGFYIADHVHIYSNVELQETKAGGIYFDPFRGDYLIGAELYHRNISLGILHECNHDIVTNMKFNRYNGWEAAFEMVYLNYFLPIYLSPEFVITPSITLADRFLEKVRIKSNDKNHYFDPLPAAASPNIFSPEFALKVKYYYLQAGAAFQAGYAMSNHEWAYTQFRLGAEVFYKNISLGLSYTNRRDIQQKAGYSLERLDLFIRFRGKSSLL
jgi:hypothetical protein